MEHILLATLLRSWADQLEEIIADLDQALPLERQYKTKHVRNLEEGFSISIASISFSLVTPERNPELFTEIQEPLPHAELDPLRELLADIQDLETSLTGETPKASTSSWQQHHIS